MDDQMGMGRDVDGVLEGESMGEPVVREMTLGEALSVLGGGDGSDHEAVQAKVNELLA